MRHIWTQGAGFAGAVILRDGQPVTTPDLLALLNALEAKPQARSTDDHRRFFALIKAAFEHWPDGFEFRPDNAEHLRAYLLCRARYRTTTMIEVDEPAKAVFVIEVAFRAAGAYAFVRPYGDGLAIHAPKSIKWETLPQKQFNDIRDSVTGIIEDVVGVSAEQLLTERAA